MLRILVIIILLFSVSNSFAAEINGRLRFGVYLKNNLFFAEQDDNIKYATLLEVWKNTKYMTIGTSVETWMEDFSDGSFSPNTVIYTFKVESIEWEGLKGGYVHDCWHGINRNEGVIIRDMLYAEYTF